MLGLLIVVILGIMIANAIQKSSERNKKRFEEMLMESAVYRVLYGVTFSLVALFGTFMVLGVSLLSWFIAIVLIGCVWMYMHEMKQKAIQMKDGDKNDVHKN